MKISQLSYECMRDPDSPSTRVEVAMKCTQLAQFFLGHNAEPELVEQHSRDLQEVFSLAAISSLIGLQHSAVEGE